MNQCSRRPLAAGVGVFALALAGGVPGAVGDCMPPLECVVIPVDEDELVEANGATTALRLADPNLAVASVLSQLDIDGDGIADGSQDTDGDGLPDNWERGGYEALTADGERIDRVVFFPAPTAIVPGTPPTPIFTRFAVATDALDPDTDGDGISDFVEVFGLMFIDENRNGLLDRVEGETARYDEWHDKNSDGLPSPGEYPRDNTGEPFAGRHPAAPVVLQHDFDGFVFTDPTNPDTDGDGLKDGVDNDPLINPRAFGNAEQIIVRFNATGNADIDQDGLGNGMDMGNDIVRGEGTPPSPRDMEVIDNPLGITEFLELFREDLLNDQIMPESAIEDLLGADWDGNGLWRITDVRTWSIVIDPSQPAGLPPEDLFTVGTRNLYATQTYDELKEFFNAEDYKVYGKPGIGLGWQNLLEPSGATGFIPDPRVWAILYAWRVPGFDIDGDGFIGVPNISSAAAYNPLYQPTAELATVALRQDSADDRFLLSNEVPIESALGTDRPFDDRIEIDRTTAPSDTDEFVLDGRIDLPPGFRTFSCGAFGMIALVGMMFGLAVPKWLRRRR